MKTLFITSLTAFNYISNIVIFNELIEQKTIVFGLIVFTLMQWFVLFIGFLSIKISFEDENIHQL